MNLSISQLCKEALIIADELLPSKTMRNIPLPNGWDYAALSSCHEKFHGLILGIAERHDISSDEKVVQVQIGNSTLFFRMNEEQTRTYYDLSAFSDKFLRPTINKLPFLVKMKAREQFIKRMRPKMLHRNRWKK